MPAPQALFYTLDCLPILLCVASYLFFHPGYLLPAPQEAQKLREQRQQEEQAAAAEAGLPADDSDTSGSAGASSASGKGGGKGGVDQPDASQFHVS